MTITEAGITNAVFIRFADHFLDIYQLGADVYHFADRSD